MLPTAGIRRICSRRHFRRQTGISATIMRADQSHESIDVGRLDLSETGARIEVGRPIHASQLATLRIDTEHPVRSITLRGDSCTVRPPAGAGGLLECRFDPPLPPHLLEEFSAEGVRSGQPPKRPRTALRAASLLELDGGMTPVRMEDYSASGFCLRCRSAGRVGDRMRLQLQSHHHEMVVVSGRVRWIVQADDGFVLGCVFVVARDVEAVQRIVENKTHSLGGRSSRSSRRVWRGSLANSIRDFVTATAFLICILGSWAISAADLASGTSPRAEVAVPREASPSARGPAAAVTIFREWTDDTGRFRVNARLVNLNDDSVELQCVDGRVVSVPRDRLSGADARYIGLTIASGGSQSGSNRRGK